MILQEHEELGLPFSESQIGTALFIADDTTLLTSALENIERQLDLVDKFSSVSGAKLNRSKC
ncbi:hypothetical protein H310_14693 [Aphanomyces invadans]|uniref:Uncharacterized protein n=1 Tax=Aphanomyces invadans TaxID=157072 RepID=A0A024T998_9STRA|nr:hypothetical protein H310_14693 [Aphanomyces invadans]ETV90569.1 hypothetical protein H310_14693 [Aphanomyces invadans]|eukprot:XP_008880819.1 hypothetical protein H310_14693 [Aphanomyces invadans]